MTQRDAIKRLHLRQAMRAPLLRSLVNSFPSCHTDKSGEEPGTLMWGCKRSNRLSFQEAGEQGDKGQEADRGVG